MPRNFLAHLQYADNVIYIIIYPLFSIPKRHLVESVESNICVT